MRARAYRWIGVALALAGATAASGQSLARLADDARGTIRFAYPTSPEVCGTGDGVLIREPDGSTMFVSGRISSHDWRAWRNGGPPCAVGDAVVEMTRDGSGWSGVRIAVAAGARGPEEAIEDLGYFTGQAAADFVLAAAAESGPRSARDLILAAAIAGDAIIWPALLDMARDRAMSTRARKAALHWLGRRAARQAVDDLGGMVRDRTEDDEIREAAVFAVSQLPDEEAIPLLIDIIRTMDEPRVVNRALFWLAEFDDPRALAVFEQILVGG